MHTHYIWSVVFFLVYGWTFSNGVWLMEIVKSSLQDQLGPLRNTHFSNRNGSFPLNYLDYFFPLSMIRLLPDLTMSNMTSVLQTGAANPSSVWWIRVAHLFSVLCCAFCFVSSRTVSCVSYCMHVTLKCPFLIALRFLLTSN